VRRHPDHGQRVVPPSQAIDHRLGFGDESDRNGFVEGAWQTDRLDSTFGPVRRDVHVHPQGRRQREEQSDETDEPSALGSKAAGIVRTH
jgi:hypothetical protein